MFLLTTPTGLSHATALACLALAALGHELLRAGRPAGGALLGGGLGFLLAVRPQVAAAVGAVLGVGAAWRLLRPRPTQSAPRGRARLLALVLLAGSAGAGLVAVLLYDRAVTGSALTLPWDLYHPREAFGFGRPIEGSAYVHGARQALENLLVSAVRFNFWWLGWPASLALLFLPGVRGTDRGGLGPWPAVAAALVAVHLPYYSPGISDTGPVYYYELLLPASLAGAHGLRHAAARWPLRTPLLLGLALTLGTGTFLAEHGARLSRLLAMTQAPAAALDAVSAPALLLHETSGQEAIRLGWLFGFPVRERHPEAPVLTFPRGTPQQAAALRARFTDRSCWYYRVEPRRLAPQLLRCEEAEGLLRRPRPLPGPRLFVPSTARRLGLLRRR
jgi:hypothetical protein